MQKFHMCVTFVLNSFYRQEKGDLHQNGRSGKFSFLLSFTCYIEMAVLHCRGLASLVEEVILINGLGEIGLVILINGIGERKVFVRDRRLGPVQLSVLA